ncbi:MAG: hypothetical protein V1870_05125 [Candidatus Aenigmatarchaeota archaeon]
MIKTIAANTDGTLLMDVMTQDYFRHRYAEQYGLDALTSFSKGNAKDRERCSILKKELKASGEIQEAPMPNAELLINHLKEKGFAFVIYAGAPVESSLKKYADIGIAINGAYTAQGMNRNNPEVFRNIRELMLKNGFDPIAYLTHVPDNAKASATAWGKGLLSEPIKESDDRIYQFDWNILSIDEIEKIIAFLKK